MNSRLPVQLVHGKLIFAKQAQNTYCSTRVLSAHQCRSFASGSPPLLQSSPYEEQLFQLRQKMLRIQEERHQQRAEQDRGHGSQQRHG
jgi:hypothetical protein